MLQYFRPLLSYYLSLKCSFRLFLSGCFTQVLLYFLNIFLDNQRVKLEFENYKDLLCKSAFGSNVEKHCRNPLPASGDYCRLLIIFANSLDPDQALAEHCSSVGRALDWGLYGCWFKPHSRWSYYVVSLRCLVLVKPRKTRPDMSEKYWQGCKESNQTYRLNGILCGGFTRFITDVQKKPYI